MNRLLLGSTLISLAFFVGCHPKSRYRVWGTSYGEVGQSNWHAYLAMRKNPLYWDCEYQDPPYMPFCKVCVDETVDFLSDAPYREVDPSFCKPESEHQ
jgi:hypothetical protein